jgi:rhodanese-related sulfurtransferase
LVWVNSLPETEATLLMFLASMLEPPVEYIKITSQEAQEKMQNLNVVILDVRGLDEFNTGYIRNAISLPLSEIASQANQMLPNKQQTILVYCQAGGRSEQAARELISMGYTNVFDFGGIVDWEGEILR